MEPPNAGQRWRRPKRSSVTGHMVHQLSNVCSSSGEVVVRTTGLLLVLSGLSSALACSNPFGSGREVRLYLTELQAPSTVRAAGPLDASAVVSVGGCVSFRRLEVQRSGSMVQLTAIGHDGSGPGILCPADIRLEPRAFRVVGPFADSLVLNGHQPDGATLRRRVIVE